MVMWCGIGWRSTAECARDARAGGCSFVSFVRSFGRSVVRSYRRRARRWIRRSSLVARSRSWENLRGRRIESQPALRARHGREARVECVRATCGRCVRVERASSETDVGHRARRERGGRDANDRRSVIFLCPRAVGGFGASTSRLLARWVTGRVKVM